MQTTQASEAPDFEPVFAALIAELEKDGFRRYPHIVGSSGIREVRLTGTAGVEIWLGCESLPEGTPSKGLSPVPAKFKPVTDPVREELQRAFKGLSQWTFFWKHNLNPDPQIPGRMVLEEVGIFFQPLEKSWLWGLLRWWHWQAVGQLIVRFYWTKQEQQASTTSESDATPNLSQSIH